VIDDYKRFYFAGGKSAGSIEELALSLKEISDSEFVFHVNTAKNDFANWMEGVFEEHDLAAELRRVMERKDTVRLLEQFIHRKKKQNETRQDEEAAHHEKHSVLEQAAPEFKEESKGESRGEFAQGRIVSAAKHSLYDEPAEELELKEHENVVSVEEPVYAADEDDANSKAALDGSESHDSPLKVENEQDLSEDDLKSIVNKTKHELEIEGRHVEEEDKDHSLSGKVLRATGYTRLDDRTKFIIKEFVFGFVLGLIFGLIMLGALLNLNCY